jgi:hypothetical protein
MNCQNCGKETHGGYCDCMIVDGEFKGAWWEKTGKCNCGKDTSRKMMFGKSSMYCCDSCYSEVLDFLCEREV